MIQHVDHKFVNTISKFYKVDQHYSYHSEGAGHSTKDCINLKHKIQNLIDQKFITLQIAPPNINNNPLPNHRGANMHMIENEEDWKASEALVKINLEALEQAVASLCISKKSEFVVMTAHTKFSPY